MESEIGPKNMSILPLNLVQHLPRFVLLKKRSKNIFFLCLTQFYKKNGRKFFCHQNKNGFYKWEFLWNFSRQKFKTEIPENRSFLVPDCFCVHTASRQWETELKCHDFCGPKNTVYPYYRSPKEGDFMLKVANDVQLEMDKAALANNCVGITYDATSTLQWLKLPVMSINIR